MSMLSTDPGERLRAIEFVRCHPDEFRPDFSAWLADNFHVFKEFEARALRIAARRDHYSARTIAEVMRHDTAIGELGGEFKINGNMVPCMARLFAGLNPQYQYLFEFRREKAAA